MCETAVAKMSAVPLPPSHGISPFPASDNVCQFSERLGPSGTSASSTTNSSAFSSSGKGEKMLSSQLSSNNFIKKRASRHYNSSRNLGGISSSARAVLAQDSNYRANEGHEESKIPQRPLPQQPNMMDFRQKTSKRCQPRNYAVSSGSSSALSTAAPISSSNASLERKQQSGDGGPEMLTIEEIRRSSDGTQSLHKYLRGRLLGKGGFAKVYWCTSLDTQKAYAVKIVAKANLVKSRARQKLQAEIKIHRMLKHKRICDFKHFFEDRTNCYILLELCTSQTLNELIKRRKRLTEPEAIYYMLQLIEAVRYMHSCNVIHRDLKLGNLFLDKDLGMKVGDFGLATKLAHGSDKRSTICGTPNYIAPEVIDRDKNNTGHSFEVDIWAMGVILYAILVGKPPYEAKDVNSTYQRILKNEYEFPSAVQLSADAKHLIAGMLQTRPEDRPTIDEVRDHSFFNIRDSIPLSLPAICTHVAPTWRKNEEGKLVPEVDTRKISNIASFKQKKLYEGPGPGNPIPTRRPLSRRDMNQMQTHRKNAGKVQKPVKTSSGNTNFNSQRVNGDNYNEKVGKNVVTKPARKFKVFNENQNSDCRNELREQPERDDRIKNNSLSEVRSDKPAQQHVLADDELAMRTKAMSIVSATSNPLKTQITTSPKLRDDKVYADIAEKVEILCPVTSNVKSGRSLIEDTQRKEKSDPNAISQYIKCATAAPVVENDINMLQSMHNLLARSFCNAENLKVNRDECDSDINTPFDEKEKIAAETKWVTRYVDYTSKYGLGFLLNDGSAGVYFNDSTKAILAPAGDMFQYIERRKSQQTNVKYQNSCDPFFQTYTLSSYPESLQKKVTLLKHFRNYLLEKKPEEKDEKDNAQKQDSTTTSISKKETELVYLKKWVRTRHAILFRLSNRTVQVVFYDQSEVLLSCDTRVVTYVDKTEKRSTYPINEITKDPTSEIAKRLKYAMDILHQLISGSTK